MFANYNLIQAENRVRPYYHPKADNRRMKCVFISEKEILLFGMADNNYLFWISKTYIADMDLNAEIIEYILYGKYNRLASSGEEVNVINRYGKIGNELYYFDLFQSMDYQGKKIWTNDTDINIEYGNDKGNGRILAYIIANMPQKLLKQSKARQASGSYKRVLEEYIKMMEITLPDPVEDYYRIEDVLKIIKLERYLLFSDDLEIRKMYCRICDLGEIKYNKYMTIVR